MMNVSIRQVVNGWIVYNEQGRPNEMHEYKSMMVFNSFDDLAAHLRSLSGVK